MPTKHRRVLRRLEGRRVGLTGIWGPPGRIGAFCSPDAALARMTVAIGLARRRSLPQVSACSDIRSGKVGQRQEEGRGPDGSCK